MNLRVTILKSFFVDLSVFWFRPKAINIPIPIVEIVEVGLYPLHQGVIEGVVALSLCFRLFGQYGGYIFGHGVEHRLYRDFP